MTGTGGTRGCRAHGFVPQGRCSLYAAAIALVVLTAAVGACTSSTKSLSATNATTGYQHQRNDGRPTNYDHLHRSAVIDNHSRTESYNRS
jgi:hypothetical protein